MSDDRLRRLWDETSLDVTRENLETALGTETTHSGQAELLSQLARVEVKRGRLDRAQSLLDEAGALAGDDSVARARLLLEQGRVARRRDGDEAALPVLEEAYEAALAAGQHFMAADAAHSCALAGDMLTWTERGLDLAGRFQAAAYWRGTLLLNLGDWQWARGEAERSLASFEAALAARESETRNPYLTEYARYGLARALRAVGRVEDAIPLLEKAVAWVEERELDSPESRQFREELAAAYEEARAL